MRVLMLVQQIDERDWLRAFIVAWVRALAGQVEAVDVITLEQGEAALPANVTVWSLGKEAGKNRARELGRFHRGMLRLAPRADVIFSHMTPRYTLLAAPYAALFGKRQVLWYTHRHASWQLRLAHLLCWRVTTAMPDSFPIPSAKVRALGHGIDTEFFAPAAFDVTNGRGMPRPYGESGFVGTTPASSAVNMPPASPAVPLTPQPPRPQVARGSEDVIVQVARLMPIKHQATLLRALARLTAAQGVVIGAVPTGQEQYAGYADGLRALAAELGIDERVTFAGGLLPPDVRDWYRRAAVAVNLSPPGLFDKAVLESMASGVPTLVATHSFDDLLGEHAPLLRIDSPDDAAGLAERLHTLLLLTPAQRARIGAHLRARVVESHSLARLMPRLVNVFTTGEP